MDKKMKLLLMAIGIGLLIAIVSISFAFFTIGNKTGTESVITSGTMGLHLEDGPEIILEKAVPGSSATKVFYVENTGNVDTAYDIYLSEVVNTFVDKTDLVYTLTSNDGGYSTIGQVQAPGTSAKIVDSKPIAVGARHHYTLVLTFLNKDENQDDNQGVEFKGKVQINEYKDASGNNGGGVEPAPSLPPEVIVVTGDIDTPGSELCIGTECFYVIDRDGYNLTMLAKYNLNVGTDTVPGTQGIQNENAIGYGTVTVNGQSKTNPGGVKFSDSAYWDTTISEQYVYTNEKENGNYKASIASYVDGYVTYLTGLGVDVTGRLVNRNDLDTVGCGTWSCPSDTAPNWIKDRFYWFGFANGGSIVIVSPNNSNIMGIPYNQAIGGVRPVIQLVLS